MNALRQNQCEFGSSVNAVNNIKPFLGWELIRQAGCLRYLGHFRSERRGDERDFGRAQDYRAAGRTVRVLDRNDSHRFWF